MHMQTAVYVEGSSPQAMMDSKWVGPLKILEISQKARNKQINSGL